MPGTRTIRLKNIRKDSKAAGPGCLLIIFPNGNARVLGPCLEIATPAAETISRRAEVLHVRGQIP
jgi:hypothetical protein